MAGKIVADTLEHSTAGSVTTDYVVEGSAKAWIKFNGSGTIATIDSFNISAIHDEGTGYFGNSFTNSFTTNDYNYGGHCVPNTLNDYARIFSPSGASGGPDATTGRCNGRSMVTTDASTEDTARIGNSVLGDLA
jgi:hypothetical protein